MLKFCKMHSFYPFKGSSQVHKIRNTKKLSRFVLLMSFILALLFVGTNNTTTAEDSGDANYKLSNKSDDVDALRSDIHETYGTKRGSYVPVKLSKPNSTFLTMYRTIGRNKYHLDVSADEKRRVKVNGVPYNKAKGKMSEDLIKMIDNIVKEEEDLYDVSVYSDKKDSVISYSVDIDMENDTNSYSTYYIYKQLSIKSNGLDLTSKEKQNLYVQLDEKGDIKSAYYTEPKEESHIKYLSNGQDVNLDSGSEDDAESQEDGAFADTDASENITDTEEGGDEGNNNQPDTDYDSDTADKYDEDAIINAYYDEKRKKQEGIDNDILQASSEQEINLYYLAAIILGGVVGIVAILGIIVKFMKRCINSKQQSDYGAGPYSPLRRNSIEKTTGFSPKNVAIGHDLVRNARSSFTSNTNQKESSNIENNTPDFENDHSPPESVTTMVKILTNEQ